MDGRDDLFRRSFNDSPVGMVILDSSGRYLEINDSFTRILGRSKADFVGRHFAEFTHPDDLPRDMEMLDRLAAGHVSSYQIHKRLIHREGDTIWVRVTVSSVASEADSHGHRFVVHIEDVTEVRRARDLLERRALYDHLTGLANRTLLMERLSLALQAREGKQRGVACMFIDLDHFKTFNDSLGHDAGDALLTEIAKRIQDAVRAADTLARLGGDEFVVLLEGITDGEEAMAAAHLIADAVRRPVLVNTHEVVPTFSAGVAVAQQGTSAEALVRDADQAMYAAKKAGRDRVELFHGGMRDLALTRLSIESELRTAIREGGLVVHYQPVVDLETRDVVAYEALVRWNHPQRGLLLPDEFIPISEDANLVVPLGAAVLMQACEFLAARPGFTGKVFVNVSTRQIGTADLTRVVQEALRLTGASPSQLALEITETGVLLATAAARADLGSLTELGVELIIDDFGTGYSALSSVLQNPVSGLKLARDFTLRLGDRGTGDRISIAVASLTRSLDMFGVIEGIETEAQFAIARRHGWQLGQGFLFGHALAAEDIATGLPEDRTSVEDEAAVSLPASVVEPLPATDGPVQDLADSGIGADLPRRTSPQER